MSWTRAADLKGQVNKWWDRGELLSSMVCNGTEVETPDSDWPRRLKFTSPSPTEITESFEFVRKWIAEVRSISHCRIEMKEVNHRIFGRNAIPFQAWIDSQADALSLIGKRKEAGKFVSLVQIAGSRHPRLLPWMKQKPLQALALHDEFERLLSVVDWMLQHPRPNVYLRQVDIPNVDTKFIESNRNTLSEWLELLLPPEAINYSEKTSQFARRYGFKDKPARVRFRALDSKLSLVKGSKNIQDVTLDVESFSRIDASSIDSVFITENEINFLSFPELSNSLVIFGAGYGLAVLEEIDWLLHCRVFYWGDIDTHGFAILNEARTYIQHVQSLLMDEETVLSHLDLKDVDKTPHSAIDFRNLSDDERRLYYSLKANKYATNFRLEQEQIKWDYALAAIEHAHGGSKQAHNQFEQARDQCEDAATSKDRHSSSSVLSCQTPLKIGSREIMTFLKPSECELRAYFKMNGTEPSSLLQEADLRDETQIERTTFEDVIKELSWHHEKKHRDSHSSIVDLSNLLFDDRIEATKNAIADRVRCIYKPLLALPAKLAGNSAVVTGEPDFLIFEDGSYVVREAKLARRITKEEHPEIFLEAQLHGWLLSRISGIPPLRLEVLNGQSELIQIYDDRGRAAIKILNRIALQHKKGEELYSPVGWTKCSRCEFKQSCWAKAVQSQDVALLVGVDSHLAKTLHHIGVTTIDSLLASFDEAQIANVQRPYGDQGFQKVGEIRATQILNSARALQSRQHIQTGEIVLPESDIHVMFDLEGMPPLLDGDEKIYLWGLKTFASSLERNVESPYWASVVDFDESGDGRAWFEFLAYARTIFDRFGDIPFIHWHHFERTKIRLYQERFGDIDGIANRVVANLVDLLALMRNSVALPLPSYSLKEVEKYVGFQRTQKEFGGEWAMAKFTQAIETQNEPLRNQLLDEILLYNEEDLDALWAVYKWISHLKPE